jgi:hypothetical protein
VSEGSAAPQVPIVRCEMEYHRPRYMKISYLSGRNCRKYSVISPVKLPQDQSLGKFSDLD